MQGHEAQLSAIAGSLDELTRRVTTLADEITSGRDDEAGAELYEVERLLQHAGRRLERLLR